MVDEFGVQSQLAAIILEIYDVLCLQEHRCHIRELGCPDKRREIADRAAFVMNNWHELHEFDAEAHANPDLLRALLIMYSDTIASYHSLAACGGEAPWPPELPSQSH